MKKLLLSVALVIATTLTISAQSMRYDVLATSQRNMQTEQFGKAEVVDFKIKYEPKFFVTIATDTFKIVSEKDELPNDSDGFRHREITATDNKGNEYIIVFDEDPAATTELMRHFVIKFNTSNPYDWTYYFTEAPKPSE